MTISEETSIADLFGKAQLLHFLSDVFLVLPTEEYLETLAALDWRAFPFEGSALIGSWFEASRSHPTDALIELGRDRSALMRSMGPRAIEPPYESLYRQTATNLSIGSLNRFYGAEGYRVSDDVRDTSDQLGVELAFDALLHDKILAALEEGNEAEAIRVDSVRASFEGTHLGQWASCYAAAMATAAQTDFYRGVAHLIAALPLEAPSE